jgi:hypothetical protein
MNFSHAIDCVIFCIYIILLDIFQKSIYVNVHRLHEIK